MITFHSLYAQNTPGANATAMGGSAIMLEDVWGGFHNQAALTSLKGLSAGVFYENRFLVAQLSDKGIIAAMPFRNSCFGVQFRSFGYNAFNHSKAGLAYAIRLSEKFSLGVQVNYYSTRIGENYGSRSTAGAEAGFLYKMNSRLSLAAHISNPTRARIADFNDERLPTILRAGAGYRFSEKVMLNAEVKKPDNANVTMHGGLEYRPGKQVALRAGFNTLQTFSFGFGWNSSMLQADIAAALHPTLGLIPQLSLTYTGNRE